MSKSVLQGYRIALCVAALLLGVVQRSDAAPAEGQVSDGSEAVRGPASSEAFCPPLPPPGGNVIDVYPAQAGQLMSIVLQASPGDTILLHDGTYDVPYNEYIYVKTDGVTIRSASGNREAVVIDGHYNDGQTGRDLITIAASDVTIADLTVKRSYDHPIHVHPHWEDTADIENALIYNVHVIDPGQQAVKVNAQGGHYADNGVVACSHIELTDAGRPHIRDGCYTGGVDGPQVWGWEVRDNLIEGFWCADGLSEHAVHFWTGSRGTVVARNVLVDNARGIGFRLGWDDGRRAYDPDPCPVTSGSVGHFGGVVRNNFIFAGRAELLASTYGFDCGICLAQACGARVLHNTVASTVAPFSSIGWRFSNTDAEIINNLVTHVSGSAQATSGAITDVGGIGWRGVVPAGASVTVTFRITAEEAAAIANTAAITDRYGTPTLVTALANARRVALPVVSRASQPRYGGDSLAPEDGDAIIIDHTCTDLSKVPDYWLERAKELAIHYAHTSHGSQINSGLGALEQGYPKYDTSIFYAGASPPTSLSCDPGTLCIYDGNPPETYITPEDYWSSEDGRNRTRAVADTGLFDYSMWSWCGQQSSNPTTTVQLYLDALDTFEQEYPGMRFIYMTGHTDDQHPDTLKRNNDMVRDYVRARGKVLFDFADIESWLPDGTPYPNPDDACPWCAAWCSDHPEDCMDLPASCAHSHPLNCKLKARAFWWMMARLAGWEGPASGARKTVSTPAPSFGQTVTYTVVVRDLAAPLTATLHLTDEVPAGLLYVAGTLTATTGIVTDAAPTLHWSGLLTPTPAVSITYAVTVATAMPTVITNTALIVAPGYDVITRTAVVIANGRALYLPLAMR